MPHDLSETSDLYLTWLTALGYSPATVKAYRSDLDLLTAWVVDRESKDPTFRFPKLASLKEAAADLTSSTLLSKQVETVLAEFLTEHRSVWKPATVVRRISSLRSFGRWIFDDDRFLRQYRAPTPPPMEPHPVSGGIPAVRIMISQARQPHHKALLALCGLLGLRVSEARSITPMSFTIDGNRGATAGGIGTMDTAHSVKLTVRGKGDKTRTLDVHPEVWKILFPAFRDAWHHDFRGTGPCELVPLSDRGARAYISRHGLRETGETVASHDLRSTFATASYEAGKDLAATQELMGHSDINQTKGYTLISDDAKRRASDFFGGTP